ncbi:hypothetical protein RAD15_09095 [Bradyrhizobium sp. 14AA]
MHTEEHSDLRRFAVTVEFLADHAVYDVEQYVVDATDAREAKRIALKRSENSRYGVDRIPGRRRKAYAKLISKDPSEQVGRDGKLLLPEGSKVTGCILLTGRADLTTLPSYLHVTGSLSVAGTSIEQLPRGLRVGLSLDISDTAIAELPEDLHVGGFLYARRTAIKQIPPTVRIGLEVIGLDETT